jgi:hypothetical protein
MTRKTTATAIIVLLAISIVELLLIKPIIPAYYIMSPFWKVAYSLILFGFPILIIIPLSLLMAFIALLIKGKRSFKTVWYKYTQNSYLVVLVLILIINSTLIFSKFGLDNDPFPLPYYSEIKGFEGNLDDVKIGMFETKYGPIRRYEGKQVEYYNTGDSVVLKIEWLSANEYRLINQGDGKATGDTLDVRITNNTSKYYECFVKLGQYAAYQKVLKK